jgi:hypothetical protein
MKVPLLLSVLLLNLSYDLQVRSSVVKPIQGLTQVGSLKLSPLGFGTWSWGNRFLWQYKQEDNGELENVYKFRSVKWLDLTLPDLIMIADNLMIIDGYLVKLSVICIRVNLFNWITFVWFDHLYSERINECVAQW